MYSRSPICAAVMRHDVKCRGLQDAYRCGPSVQDITKYCPNTQDITKYCPSVLDTANFCRDVHDTFQHNGGVQDTTKYGRPAQVSVQKSRPRSRKAKLPDNFGGGELYIDRHARRQTAPCKENSECPRPRPAKCGRRTAFPETHDSQLRQTPPPADGDWEPGVDPYNVTCAGYLGTHRPSMLGNCLLQRSELGKRPPLCPKLRPDDFRYGSMPEGKGETVKDVFSWPKGPEKLPPVRPPDFLTLNRAAITSGATTAKDLAHFRHAHSLRRRQLDTPTETGMPAIVFGAPSGHHDSMHELLSDKPRNEWIRTEKVCQRLGRNLERERHFMKSKRREETKASQLRLLANAPRIEEEPKLWQMPRFQQAKPAISTFRKKTKC